MAILSFKVYIEKEQAEVVLYRTFRSGQGIEIENL